ncbi:MAG: hypothetical protein WDW19_03480 [Neisseriaceae bacterium]
MKSSYEAITIIVSVLLAFNALYLRGVRILYEIKNLAFIVLRSVVKREIE